MGTDNDITDNKYFIVKNIATIKKQNTPKYFGLYSNIPKGINLKMEKEANLSLRESVLSYCRVLQVIKAVNFFLRHAYFYRKYMTVFTALSIFQKPNDTLTLSDHQPLL